MKTKIKYLLVLVLASFVFVGCCTMPKSAQWEYKTYDLTNNATDVDSRINNLASEGWILVAAVPEVGTNDNNGVNGQTRYIFKRLKH